MIWTIELLTTWFYENKGQILNICLGFFPLQKTTTNIQNLTCQNRWATEDINSNLLRNSWEFFVIGFPFSWKYMVSSLNLTINWLIKMTFKDDSYDSVHQMKHRKAFFTIYCYFSTINFYAIFVNANDQNINKNQDSCACAYCTGTFSAHTIKVHITYELRCIFWIEKKPALCKSY